MEVWVFFLFVLKSVEWSDIQVSFRKEGINKNSFVTFSPFVQKPPADKLVPNFAQLWVSPKQSHSSATIIMAIGRGGGGDSVAVRIQPLPIDNASCH